MRERSLNLETAEAVHTHTHTHTLSLLKNRKEQRGIFCQDNLSIGKSSTNGITLVALVVTIVILLILAGITLTYVLGDNGIIKLAQKAKNETEAGMQKEQDELENLGGNTTNPPAGDKTVADVVDKIQTENKTVEDNNGNKITIPGGFKVVPNSPEGTDASKKVDYMYNGNGTPAVQDGIVIEDEEGNQFVWIPVGEIKNKDGTTTTITLGRYTFASNGTPTLHQNADDYTQTVTIKSYYQELTSNSGNTAAKNLGDFVTKTKANGGYYLGRYEASKGIDDKVKSQADKEVWAKITQPQAATAAQETYSNAYIESDLINSYTWDTAIVFIQNYSGNTNYANKKSVNTTLKNTGMSGDKVCNIYDMASNCYEWSTEYSNYTGSSGNEPCVCRGGNYINSNGSTYFRYDNTATASAATSICFRPFCYVK